jgi:hypothetical protein
MLLTSWQFREAPDDLASRTGSVASAYRVSGMRNSFSNLLELSTIILIEILVH